MKEYYLQESEAVKKEFGVTESGLSNTEDFFGVFPLVLPQILRNSTDCFTKAKFLKKTKKTYLRRRSCQGLRQFIPENRLRML